VFMRREFGPCARRSKIAAYLRCLLPVAQQTTKANMVFVRMDNVVYGEIVVPACCAAHYSP
jgi:hypothetical protein